jgi:hypothetical protein
VRIREQHVDIQPRDAVYIIVRIFQMEGGYGSIG